MELEQARRDLHHALASAATEARDASRYRAARTLLVACGAEALGIAASPGSTLADIIRTVADAPASEQRRCFAILLVHALAVPGLVCPVRGARRSTCAPDISRLMETAIAGVLLRSGYPFAAGMYERLRFLEQLHAGIDDHLRPFEPTFPPWLHGLETR